MGAAHSIGLRELRHNTGEVLRRVRAGETLDVTDRGKPIAQIVPIGPPQRASILDELERQGRLIPATSDAPLPTPLEGDGTNRWSESLYELRDEERY